MSRIYDDDKFFEVYAQMPRSRFGLVAAGEWHQLQKLFPDLNEKKVLDLGCGYGWHCYYAIENGADCVLGIDCSNKMLERAKILNGHEKISYELCDIEQYTYPESCYDVVISNLVLHYIEDLERIYQKIYQTLKKGGHFIFNIEHPSFTAGVNQDWIYDENGIPKYWAIDDYYFSGKRKTIFLGHCVEKQHHTLTQILNGLLNVGFQIEAVEEAMPSADMMDIPGMKDEMRRPMMLLVRAVK